MKVNKTHMTARPKSAANVIHKAEIKCIKQVQFSELLKDTYHTNRSSGLTHACKSFLAFWEPLDHTSHLLMIGSQTLSPYTHTSLFRQKGAPACKSPCHWFLLSIQRDVLLITVKIRERHPLVSSWVNERRNERWTLFFNRSSNASDYANLWDTSLKIPQIEGGWKKTVNRAILWWFE